MCGRFVLNQDEKTISNYFDVATQSKIVANYNITPTQAIWIVRAHDQNREIMPMRWGLIPHWLKKQTLTSSLGVHWINARAETIDEKPVFKHWFKQNRCLIIASGFYEWQQTASGKQPFYITTQHKTIMAFAGIWDKWVSLENEKIESCAIITTEANLLLSPIHHRMPVILKKEDFDRWLNPNTEISSLKKLLIPSSSPDLFAYPVSKNVNKTTHNDITLIEPLNNH